MLCFSVYRLWNWRKGGACARRARSFSRVCWPGSNHSGRRCLEWSCTRRKQRNKKEKSSQRLVYDTMCVCVCDCACEWVCVCVFFETSKLALEDVQRTIVTVSLSLSPFVLLVLSPRQEPTCILFRVAPIGLKFWVHPENTGCNLSDTSNWNSADLGRRVDQ